MFESENYIAIPPGETMKELLRDRGIKQKELADRVGMSEKHISQLINGKVNLTYDVALKLENVFGIPASFWNNLESKYRETIAKIEDENNLEDEKKLVKKMPYADAAKLEWLPKTRSMNKKINELRKFFSVSSLKNVNSLSKYSIAYRQLNKTDKSKNATLIWFQQAINLAEHITMQPLDIEELKNQIDIIKKFTLYEDTEFIGELQQILAQCGITFVALPSFPSSYLQGLAFEYNKRTILAVSDRNKKADIFWFTLFHEISHIISGHLEYEEDISEEMENEIDKYAQNLLISPQNYQKFIQDNNFTERKIKEFAKNNGLHPGIIVGRLQNDGKINHFEFNHLRKNIDFSNVKLA